MNNDIIAGILLMALVCFFLYAELIKPVVKRIARKRAEKKQRMELLEQRINVLDAKQEIIRKALEASENITKEVMSELNRQKYAERSRRNRP